VCVCIATSYLATISGTLAATTVTVPVTRFTFVQSFVFEALVRVIALISTRDVDISPSSQSDRELSALNYGLTPNCNLSQSRHGHTPIAFAHTTGNSNTNLSQVSYRNLLRSHYKQGFNHCERSYTQVYQHLNAHQLHLNAPYKHLSASVLTSPVGRTN
jgi:hypothetical protein